MTVRWIDRPELRRPALIAAFQGWNDAGDAATDAVRWLTRMTGASPIATLDPEEYLDYQAARPTVELIDGVMRTVNWPSLSFSAARMASGRDLVLLLGIEPNLRWRAFCDDVVAVARTTGAEIVVTLGALLGDTPHSRPIRCTGSATDEVLAAPRHGAVALWPDRNRRGVARQGAATRLRFGVDLGSGAALRRVTTEPQGHAILDKLASLLDLSLELTDLDIASAAWERSVADVVASDSEVTGYVARLEARYDESLTGALTDDDEEEEDDDDWLDEDDLPSGDSLAEDFERYLRENREE